MRVTEQHNALNECKPYDIHFYIHKENMNIYIYIIYPYIDICMYLYTSNQVTYCGIPAVPIVYIKQDMIYGWRSKTTRHRIIVYLTESCRSFIDRCHECMQLCLYINTYRYTHVRTCAFQQINMYT